jgi:hypothetical protein
MDTANNTKQVNYTYTLLPVITVTLKVVDNQTGEPITGADVSLDTASHSNQNMRTLTTGLAYIDVDPGSYRIFVSMAGYKYAIQDIMVNETYNPLVTIPLQRDNTALPIVSIASPLNGGTVVSAPGTPINIQFSVQYDRKTFCTLYTSADASWFVANATMNVSDNGAKVFAVPMPEGQYSMRIECADALQTGRTGFSPTIRFTVSAQGITTPDAGAATTNPATASSPTGSTSEEIKLQQYADLLDTMLNNLEGYGQREKDAAIMIGYDKQLRNAKRAVQQAIRDISDLQYHQDMGDGAKAAERKRIADGIDALMIDTPRGIDVKDSKTVVRYLKDDEKDAVAAQLVGLGGMSGSQNVIAEQLMKDQQKFTMSTKMLQLEYLYADGTTKPVTVVTRSFTYAKNLSPDYAIYEIIPKEIAKSARELTLLSKAETLKDDPILRFTTEQSITYIIPKRVDFTRLDDIRTVIARPYAAQSNMLTGFAIFGANDIAGVSTPLLIIIILIIIAYVVYYFDLHKHAQFIFYKFGKKGKVHYVRVMINDALDNLEADNYEKASMLYKEIRLSYDALPIMARNDLYDEVIGLLKKMDTYYFNMVMIELDQHIKAGDMAAAIQSYEKLTGVYTHLDAPEQQRLVSTVTALGHRLGLGVNS